MAELPSEISKPKTRGNTLKIVGVLIILAVAVLLVYFLFFRTSNFGSIGTVAHNYKISITHNNQPLETSFAGSFVYQLDLYNETSYCGNEYVSSGSVQSSSYTFDSNSKNGAKTLKEYENQGSAFDFSATSNFSSGNRNWFVSLSSANALGAALNYNQLPKLSSDFSVTFEIPIFTKSSYWKNASATNLHIHSEMIDDWSGSGNFICLLRRQFGDLVDVNLSDCGTQSSFLRQNNVQCTSKGLAQCGLSSSTVSYVVNATRSGRNVDCDIPLSGLTSGQNYEVRIAMYKELGNNLYLSYRTTKLENLIV